MSPREPNAADVVAREPAGGRARAGAAGSAGLLQLRGVSKRYGHTRALAEAELDVRPGEVLGLVGHNGAGKSTLMRVVVGVTDPDAGSLELDGAAVSGAWSPAAARGAGVRIVFQELSLCPDLRVFENVLVTRPALAGRGWRTRARELILRQLDEVFPGHGISPWSRISRLSLAQRQMVEVAGATLGTSDQVRLVILDEPTSALPHDFAASLFRYLRRRRDEGVSFIFISHRIGEVLANTDRVVVMRDGRSMAARSSADLSEDDVVTLMGGTVRSDARTTRSQRGGSPSVEVSELSTRRLRGVTLTAHPGEIVGIAGLEGQGQHELLLELWRRRRRRGGGVRVRGRIAFVTGNRQEAGVFPLWPLSLNLSVASLHRLKRGRAVSPRAERALAGEWIERLRVRGELATPVLDLSGGTQQKVLIARALATGADTVLLDDPFRGVDVTTRQEIYALLREEAAGGRSFLWYSTESAEVEHCDRIYIFRHGAIVAELQGDEITEEDIISASFRDPREVGQGDGDAVPGEGTA